MVERLSQHIIALSIKHGKEVTAQSMNRLLFFTIGLTIKQGTPEEVQFIKDKYRDDFERWSWGAVAPLIYYRLRTNGGSRVLKPAKYHEDLAMFDRLIIRLLDARPSAMVNININMASHKMWKHRIEANLHVPNWTYKEIEYEFHQLKGRV